MKKVLIIRHAYYPSDPRVRKEAVALIDKAYEVDVICLRNKSEQSRDNVYGVNIYRIPLSHKRRGVTRYIFEYTVSFLLFALVVPFLYFKKRYDVIQVNTMPDFLVFVTLIPKLCGAKVVLDLHEPVPELWVTKYGPSPYRFMFWAQARLEQLAICYADGCLTVTEALRRRFGERGANIDKVVVIPNVCDETTFFFDSDAKKHDFEGKFTVVTHGLIEERYGHALVVRAVNELRDKLPDLLFEIVGDGEYRARIERLVRDLKCEDYVHFSGYVSTDQLLQKIRGADVVIISMQASPYSELIDTNKMYEYVALRKPVIASHLPSLTDNFDDSCLQFFEPGNHEDLARCILKLYHNPEKRHELVENAYRRYEKVRWRETKKIYLKVIENLIGERKE